MKVRHNQIDNKQQGAALIMALIILTVITILGTSGIKNSLMKARLSQSFSHHDYAFQMAEVGLRHIEKFLASSADHQAFQNHLIGNNILIAASDTGDYSSSAFWNGVSFMGSQFNLKAIVEMKEVVQDSLDLSSPVDETVYYKITVRGIDGEYVEYLKNNNDEKLAKARSVVILQSIFAKRY